MNKKLSIKVIVFLMAIVASVYLRHNYFNPPFFNFFSNAKNDFFSDVDKTFASELKSAADKCDLKKAISIINNPEKMKTIDAWGLGMAIAFAAFQSKNKDNCNEIVQAILDSGYPIDNDYLGEVLIYAVSINDLDMVKSILANPYGKYIDKSFKIAIFFQSYMGSPQPMPSSFLKQALNDSIKHNHEKITSELMAFSNKKFFIFSL
ncbi:MAG: hypothetical protein NTZ68_00695 [Candidatus Dependentiae bacterium]|nr:hypothetical protein [Candidatus Dependentiae bacterium]